MRRKYSPILRKADWVDTFLCLSAQRYVAGDVHHLVRGEIKQYKFHEGGFAIELAQGESTLLCTPTLVANVSADFYVTAPTPKQAGSRSCCRSGSPTRSSRLSTSRLCTTPSGSRVSLPSSSLPPLSSPVSWFFSGRLSHAPSACLQPGSRFVLVC